MKPVSEAVTATVEPQYQALLDLNASRGLARLGLMSNQVWHDDPRRLAFTLARYKFVSKMLDGRAKVLELGCGDAFATRIVQQSVGQLSAIDIDPLFIADAKARVDPAWPMELAVHDILQGPYPGDGAAGFDAVYSLDVLEHVLPKDEDLFMRHACASLVKGGCAIIGMPSLESQAYASTQSKAGHVNCKTGSDLKAFSERWFEQVFLFSMNDEVVHTGYTPMAHYLLVLCVGPRAAT